MFIKIEPYGVIYMLKNIIDNKVYIGQTVNLKRRMNEHKNRKPSSSRRYNFLLTKIINEVGYENFETIILDSAFNPKELNEKEKYYIEKYKSYDPEFGYNSRKGDLKEKLNDTTRELMKKSHIGLKEKAETKRKKSNKIIAIKDNEFIIADSGKLFGDYIGMSKDKVKKALRNQCRIKEYYVFYFDEEKRKSINKKSKNEKYNNLLKIIGTDLETIKNLYNIKYLLYE
jgi:predicted GIY-YIG superfamily endonuclease